MDGTAYIGLGSNLGQRRAQMSSALVQIDRAVGGLGAGDTGSEGRAEGYGVTAVSRLYETAPVYVLDQPPFLNAAARVDVSMSPPDLLALLNAIEHELGRERSVRFGPRTLDLDILLWEQRPGGLGSSSRQLVMRSPDLTIPHPRLLERAFALLPLADVAAEVVHPLCHQTIGELADALGAGSTEDVAVVAGPGWAA